MELYGVRVGAIALKDIILPGDIRDILNQVVTAEKQAQANLIRRREETAATRSLLNTAKLMEDNPLLVRLKELESLEKIADKVEKITVVGGLEGCSSAPSNCSRHRRRFCRRRFTRHFFSSCDQGRPCFGSEAAGSRRAARLSSYSRCIWKPSA